MALCSQSHCSEDLLYIVQAPAVSGWGAAFLKKNKASEAKANAAVAAEIEEQKGGAKGESDLRGYSCPLCNI